MIYLIVGLWVLSGCFIFGTILWNQESDITVADIVVTVVCGSISGPCIAVLFIPTIWNLVVIKRSK